MNKIDKGLWLLLATLSLWGCPQLDQLGDLDNSDQADTESDQDEPENLASDDSGGYDSSDEEECFGMTSMDQFTEDEAVDDPAPQEETAEEAGSETVATRTTYYLRIVWGNLELNNRSDLETSDRGVDWIDWTGDLSVSEGGAIRLVRTILFDRHDEIVLEEDPSLIEWFSYTGPHLDGILARVSVPAGEEETTVAFSTDPVSIEIPVADLNQYNEIVTIDEDGHGVAIAALQGPEDDCAAGFLHGKYYDRPAGHRGGIFRGGFVQVDGALEGHLRGHYGIDDLGDQVFFGKYIDRTGRFRGLLEGTYNDGGFSGTWAGRGGMHEGDLSGKYVTGSEVDSGFFQGTWTEVCE